MNKKKTVWIVLSVFLCSFLMIFVDGWIQPSYWIKSLIKMVLFLLIPMIYVFFNHETNELKRLFKFSKKGMFTAFLIGISLYILMIDGYFVLRKTVDFSLIPQHLVMDIGVNADNFVVVAFYISLINSFLEEFFFRGYSFLFLKEKTSGWFAFVMSSFVFALYHLGMMKGWFQDGFMLVTFFGLFLGGCIFNVLDMKNETIYSGWLVHAFVNLGINTIGLILFQLI